MVSGKSQSEYKQSLVLPLVTPEVSVIKLLSLLITLLPSVIHSFIGIPPERSFIDHLTVCYLQVPFFPPVLEPVPAPEFRPFPSPLPSLGPLLSLGGPVLSPLGIVFSFMLVKIFDRPAQQENLSAVSLTLGSELLPLQRILTPSLASPYKLSGLPDL